MSIQDNALPMSIRNDEWFVFEMKSNFVKILDISKIIPINSRKN